VTGRLRGASDDRLGDALRALAGHLAWPDAEALPAAVVRRLEATGASGARPRPSLPSRRRTLVILIAALLALAAVAAAAKLVIDLGAITIETGPGLPTAVPTGAVGRSSFGRPVSLPRAAEIAGFAPRVPGELGPPDLVWADRTDVSFDRQETTTIVMAWRPRPGLPAIGGTPWGAVLMEFRGHADVATKTLTGGEARIEPASVNGRPAYVISGAHELDLLTSTGVRRFISTAIAVLWNEGSIALRLETSQDRPRALEIAGSAAG
jgi:hypothetical protein